VEQIKVLMFDKLKIEIDDEYEKNWSSSLFWP
jgi:hypothetical protein